MDQTVVQSSNYTAQDGAQTRLSKKKQAALFAFAAASAAASIALYSSQHFEKQRIHTSILTGQQWVHELLTGHDERFRRQFGMEKQVFHLLSHELHVYGGVKDSRHVTAVEQLAIFLRIARTGLGNCEMQERFQRSGDTISKYFHKVLNALVSPEIYYRHVTLPSPTIIPPEISGNPRFSGFFDDCLGAVDGSLLDAFVQEEDMSRYRSRKGRISMNLFAACNFNLTFCYLLSGWEGSAADSRVYHNARELDFAIPPSKYYLADAGFPICDGLLVPYRGVRYHLKEWERSGLRPKDAKELFNLRHSSLWNAVERIFGVWKRRFKLMTATSEYSIQTQAKIPLALAVLHNFICKHDPTDKALRMEDYEDYTNIGSNEGGGSGEVPEVPEEWLGCAISNSERKRAEKVRDEIAQKMWDQYVQVLDERNV